MATFKPSKAPPPIEISRFLGLNESVGETQIQLGEAVNQVNFRITQDYKPQKRLGHNTFINYSNTKAVQGMWYGQIASKEVLISCNDGKVYEYNFATAINTELGTIIDAPTRIFYFNDKLYFINGSDYKEYNGTTYQDVIPYVPTVFVGSAPAGGGTANEPINLLTGRKKQSFVGNGSATVYQLAELNIGADEVLITIDGVTRTEGTHFTVNRTLGTINFAAGSSPHGAPLNLADVLIEWVKTEAGNKELVTKNKYFMLYGPSNDTAIFLWGNPDQKNRRTWSGAYKANYFPVFNFTNVGSNEFAITDIVSVYDRQLIFKEDRTHYSYAEFISLTGSYDYPVYDLNQQVGNQVFGGVQIVENSPVSIDGQSWWYWENTQVKDERNARVISERIRQSITATNLTQAITFDYQKEKEYWCNVGDIVYIWNYGNNTIYKYDNISATCFLDIDGVVYYGSRGTIERFAGLNDNGVAVKTVLELGYTDFGVSQLLKNSRKVWVTLLPESLSSCVVTFRTDKKFDVDIDPITVPFSILNFNFINFNNFSFVTNIAPQTFRRKIRAKKFAYIKFILKNEELDETLTILSIKVEAETTSEVK